MNTGSRTKPIVVTALGSERIPSSPARRDLRGWAAGLGVTVLTLRADIDIGSPTDHLWRRCHTSNWWPATSLALILTALTALVAPACKVTPSASTKIPGMNRTWEPSMRMPIRPSA
jgi:hypothetical protein